MSSGTHQNNQHLLPQFGALEGIGRCTNTYKQVRILTSFLYQFYSNAILFFPEEKDYFEQMLRDNSYATKAFVELPESESWRVYSQVILYFVIMINYCMLKHKRCKEAMKVVRSFFFGMLSFGYCPLDVESPKLKQIVEMVHELNKVGTSIGLDDLFFCRLYYILYNTMILDTCNTYEIRHALEIEIKMLREYKQLDGSHFVTFDSKRDLIIE